MRPNLPLSLLGLVLLAPHGMAETFVAVEGGEIIYRGGLSEAANQQVFELYQAAADPKPQVLEITSTGGAIEVGMALGEWVYEQRMDVRVPALCFSSCANYVFPAGDVKYLHQDAVLGWHGGADSHYEMDSFLAEIADGFREEAERLVAEYLVENRKREAEFYQQLNVHPLLNQLGQLPQYAECEDAGYDGWYYSLYDMEKLGLDSIVLVDGVWELDVNGSAETPKLFLVDLSDHDL